MVRVSRSLFSRHAVLAALSVAAVACGGSAGDDKSVTGQAIVQDKENGPQPDPCTAPPAGKMPGACRIVCGASTDPSGPPTSDVGTPAQPVAIENPGFDPAKPDVTLPDETSTKAPLDPIAIDVPPGPTDIPADGCIFVCDGDGAESPGFDPNDPGRTGSGEAPGFDPSAPQPIEGGDSAPGFDPSEVACSANYDPVCGVDGKTYANACEATYLVHVKIAHDGECAVAAPAPVSGTKR